MSTRVVITGAGKDRVGIVAELTDFLFKNGCNLLDSSMTLLRGEFALILMVELPESLKVEELQAGLKVLQESLQLNFAVRKLSPEEFQEADQDRFNFIISVYGADKPGIVAGITKALAGMNLNVTDVQTKYVQGAQGEIFVMLLESSSKEELSAVQLKQKLDLLAKSMGVDISVREIEFMEL